MNYQNKTKEVIIKELQKLQQKHDSLKSSYEKNITERKRTEETLRESEEKWYKLVSTIPDYIALHDINGKYIFLNHYAEGFSEKEVVGKSLYDFISIDSKEEYCRNFDACINTKQTQRFVYSAFGDNRVFRTYENYLVPIIEKDQITIILAIARDITEHKLAQEVIKESEERYRSLFENILNGFAYCKMIFDGDHAEDFIYLKVNKAFESLTGLKDIVGKKVSEVIPGIRESDKELFDAYARVALTGIPEAFEIYVNTLEMWFSISVYCPRKEYFVAVFDVITERKLAEEALRLEKENFRHSIDDSPLGVRIATIEGNTIYANKAILDFYGYDSLGELQKTRLKDRYTPESYAQAQKRKLQREHGDFSVTEYEISIVRKNGEIRHLQVYRNEVLWNGARQFQVIYKDITIRRQAEAALRESEARFRSLFENSLMGISVTDPDGYLVQINQAYSRMYGYKNPKEMLTEVSNVRQLYSKPEERKEVLQLLRRNGFMEARTIEVIRRDGSRFPVLVSVNEIRDADGKLIYNQATQLDITERRHTEEELRNSKELLEQLNQHLHEVRENERAIISREIHDELGQSLTALKLDLNRMHTYLDNNPEAVAKLNGMIELVSDTIRDVQRISSDLRPGILDELGLVSAIEWYCDEFEKRTGIKCNLKLDNSDYEDAQINLTFFRVLQETLTNVIRHAKASSVSIKLQKLIKGATMIIRDNGIGIPEEKIRSTKSFGLISMRERVKQFNGTIDISSKKDYGTKLAIFIPS
jgi:PAS domain S-box-containing protein